MMSASALLSPVRGMADTEELPALLLLYRTRYILTSMQVFPYCDLATLAPEVLDAKLVPDWLLGTVSVLLNFPEKGLPAGGREGIVLEGVNLGWSDDDGKLVSSFCCFGFSGKLAAM